jgi:hypothetical protein
MFEILRYKFSYEIEKVKHNYELSNNDVILKNKQEFIDIGNNYIDNLLYKNIYGRNKSRPYMNQSQFIINYFFKNIKNEILLIQSDNPNNDKNVIVIENKKENISEKCKNKYTINIIKK